MRDVTNAPVFDKSEKTKSDSTDFLGPHNGRPQLTTNAILHLYSLKPVQQAILQILDIKQNHKKDGGSRCRLVLSDGAFYYAAWLHQSLNRVVGDLKKHCIVEVVAPLCTETNGIKTVMLNQLKVLHTVSEMVYGQPINVSKAATVVPAP